MTDRYNCRNRRKYSLKVHIVLVTKYRKHMLRGSIADDIKQKIFDICIEPPLVADEAILNGQSGPY